MNKQKLPTKEKTGKVDCDSAWKDLIEELFSQFLEFFFPEIHKDIDFSKKCEFLSKELRKIVKDNKVGQRFADVLVKVHLKDGSIRCLFIHIEGRDTRMMISQSECMFTTTAFTIVIVNSMRK